MWRGCNGDGDGDACKYGHQSDHRDRMKVGQILKRRKRGAIEDNQEQRLHCGQSKVICWLCVGDSHPSSQNLIQASQREASKKSSLDETYRMSLCISFRNTTSSIIGFNDSPIFGCLPRLRWASDVRLFPWLNTQALWNGTIYRSSSNLTRQSSSNVWGPEWRQLTPVALIWLVANSIPHTQCLGFGRKGSCKTQSKRLRIISVLSSIIEGKKVLSN